MCGALWAAEPGAQADRPALVWLTDLPAAQAQAKAQGKSVLLFFHGSDWCPTCKELERDVLNSPQFGQFARKSLVLVDVDFPAKRKLDEAQRQANAALKAKFNLSQETAEGFPTVVLLNAEGHTVFQETGYSGGGPAELLPRLQRHSAAELPTRSSGPYRDLSVDEFARLAADKRNIILDVRTPGEFQSGHIPGAVNLDFDAADFSQKAAALDKTRTYLVHCASGVRSERACVKLSALNFPTLYNLPGGFRAWARAGKPVEK